jgi:hypothetical protein
MTELISLYVLFRVCECIVEAKTIAMLKRIVALNVCLK